MVASKGQRFTLSVMAVGASLLVYTGIGARKQLGTWAEEWYTAWKAGKELRFKIYDVADLVYLVEPDDRLKISGSDLLGSVTHKLADRRAEAAILQKRIMVKATAWDHLKIRKLLDSLRSRQESHDP